MTLYFFWSSFGTDGTLGNNFWRILYENITPMRLNNCSDFADKNRGFGSVIATTLEMSREIN